MKTQVAIVPYFFSFGSVHLMDISHLIAEAKCHRVKVRRNGETFRMRRLFLNRPWGSTSCLTGGVHLRVHLTSLGSLGMLAPKVFVYWDQRGEGVACLRLTTKRRRAACRRLP